MDILFMGTPDFAEGVLRSIVEGKKHRVVCVVTQPDRPKGRSSTLVPSPVKEYAVSMNIPVLQPEKIKTPEAVKLLREYRADIYVVAAFGQILSAEILNIPKFGCINVHASLLPAYRGAAPIQWAIADGLSETGVTIMQMNEGMDTGDILTQKIVPIGEKETGESLFEKLKEAGALLLNETLPLIEEGKVTPVPQDELKATKAMMLRKEMGLVDFNESAVSIERLIRAFTPWPGGYTYYNNKMYKLKEVIIPNDISEGEISKTIPGTVVRVTSDEIDIMCNPGILGITRLQPEGKKEMTTHDLLLGKPIKVGEKFGLI